MILTFALFQLCWISCVKFGNAAFPGVLVYVLIYCYFSTSHPQKIYQTVFSITALGFAIDTTLTALGIFHFPDKWYIFPPLWFLGIWLAFATLLPYSAKWLIRWPAWKLSLSSAVLAPLSYYTGSILSGLHLAQPLWKSLSIVAIEWMILYPLLVKITATILNLKKR